MGGHGRVGCSRRSTAALRLHYIDRMILRDRAGGMLMALAGANLAAWVWAFMAFRHAPALLGTCLLAYGLGLRHAVDADHIAAIDNVTRKLIQDGQRPAATGLFFA